jgi:methylglutamate dehydrogenase subunit D
MLDTSSLASRPAFPMLASVGPSPAGITVCECLGRQLATIEARKGHEAQFAEQFRAHFGLSPPAGPHRASTGKLELLGLGPARWLAITADGALATLEAVERAGSHCASFIDQTDGLAVLRIGGPRARGAFAKGLPIDLDASVFANNAVAVSAIAHVGVTIWRRDDGHSFEMAVPRSYASAFADWLQESAAEFGLEVCPRRVSPRS